MVSNESVVFQAGLLLRRLHERRHDRVDSDIWNARDELGLFSMQ